MKTTFLLIFTLLTFCCNAQLLHIVGASKTATVPSGPPEYVKINFVHEFACGNDLGFNYVCGSVANISTTNGVTKTNLVKDDGTTATTIGITNLSGWTGYENAPNSGSGTGVFPDFIEGTDWVFNNGAQLQISGLTIGAQYKFYFLSNTDSWRPSVVSFTVAGITSSTVNNGANIGSSTTYPDWETDPALVSVTFTASSTTATITCNVISGQSDARLNAMVIKKI